MSLWLGIAAGLLLLSPVAFSIAKRSSADANPRLWFAIHVGASGLGAILAILHSNGNFNSPPALLLLLLAIVIGLGTWIRLVCGTGFAACMGARPLAFAAVDPERRGQLRVLLAEKTELLKRLDSQAKEAEFSPLLAHWFAQPTTSWRYLRLMEKERNLIGARRDAGAVLSWSRRLHMVFGALFVVGLSVHVIVAVYRLSTGGAG